MRIFNISDNMSRSWNLAVDNWPIFLLLSIIASAIGDIGVYTDIPLLREYDLTNHPERFSDAFNQAVTFKPFWVTVGQLLTLYVSLVTYKMLVNTVRTGKPYEDFMDVIKVDFVTFAFFLGVSILFGLAVAFGTLLCIIPGIFIAVRWMFAPIIIATEDVPFLDAFRMSWQLTQGNFWKLIGLFFCTIGVYILGLCACCVGVIFADIMVNFMYTVAYLDLKEDKETDYEEVVFQDDSHQDNYAK